MFQSIIGLVTKRFARGKKPASGESSSASTCPEVCEVPKAENASCPDHTPRPETLLSPELYRTSQPELALIPERSPSACENKTPSPEDNGSVPDHNSCLLEKEIILSALYGNCKPQDDAIPDNNSCVSEKEIRLRAYLKWEAAGKPKGAEARFWLEAKEELRPQRKARS